MATGPLAVREAGRGPVVVLIHGWGGSARTWGPFADALRADGRRTVAVDLPGWGATPAPRGFPHTATSYAAALAPLLRAHGPVDVIAHSMGAQAALWAAAGLDGAVRRLVLLAPPAVPLGRPPIPPRTLAELVSVPLAGVTAGQAAIAVMRRRASDPRARYGALLADPSVLDHPQAPALLSAAVSAFATPPARSMARALRATAREDLRPLAHRVAAPTLVVTGALDRVVDPAEGEELAGLLPAGRHMRLAGAGHLVHLERFAEVADAALAHLGGDVPAAPRT